MISIVNVEAVSQQLAFEDARLCPQLLITAHAMILLLDIANNQGRDQEARYGSGADRVLAMVADIREALEAKGMM
ncbi:MAG: hypothetical protein E6Q97_07655 [Desulfurellales bacterium]|nr:MAG: hypothetical protein E6Q97_07655 [Desulfurellales bacterium]